MLTRTVATDLISSGSVQYWAIQVTPVAPEKMCHLAYLASQHSQMAQQHADDTSDIMLTPVKRPSLTLSASPPNASVTYPIPVCPKST